MTTTSKMIFQNVRGSYVYIASPRKNKKKPDEPGKYGIQLLIKKNDPQIKKMERIVANVAKDKFGSKVKLSMLKLPMRDGDSERDTPEYEGICFINANNAKKPGIVNRSNEPADVDDLEDMGYSGSFFHVSVNFFAFETDGNKGVGASLNNVMLRKAGDRLDGTTVATDEFEEFADDDDSDEFGDDDDL